jgi:hypothetical protein
MKEMLKSAYLMTECFCGAGRAQKTGSCLCPTSHLAVLIEELCLSL